MQRQHPSTGETQVIPAEEHHGFVDSCIALIEDLLGDPLPEVQPEPTTPHTAE